MALLFLDSFDHYAYASIATKYTQVAAGSNSNATLTSVGRNSTNGLKLTVSNTGASDAYRVVLSSPAPSGATAIAGMAFRSVAAFNLISVSTAQASGPSFCSFYNAGTSQIWFRLNQAGTITAYRGTTALGTTTNALTQNVYQYIEFKVLLNGSTGTVNINVDGVSWLALTGQNTQNAGVSTWDEFYLGPSAYGLANANGWNIDDLYVADGSGASWNDFVGDIRVDATFPNAAGNTSNFTRSTGSDQSATIDETSANGDTDYNSSSTISDKDTLNFANAPVAGAVIKGIQVVCQARKTDAGAAGHKAVTRISATDYLGTEVAVPSSYAFLRQCWAVKPSDSTAWTDTDYNAAEFGYSKSS